MFVLAALVWACSPAGKTDRPEALLVAVAASAQPAVEECARTFTERTGIEVQFTTGSTGVLLRQAREGAPFDLFIGADMERVELLAAENIVVPSSVASYAEGRLVWWQRADTPPYLTSWLDIDSFEWGKINRLAIANPELAPYGAAAKQVLERFHPWSDWEPRMIVGENVRQALYYAETGNTRAALIAKSLVVTRDDGYTLNVPVDWHDPIRQGLGVMAKSTHAKNAEAFHAFLLGPASRAIFVQYGFQAPRKTTDIE